MLRNVTSGYGIFASIIKYLFVYFQIGNIMPNLGVSNCSKIPTTLPTPEVLRILRENLVVAYSAHKPDMILGYTNYDDHLDSGKS